MREPPALPRRIGPAIALACLAAAGLAACGQKGPLRLPEKSGAVIVKPAPQGENAPRSGEEPRGEER